MMQVALLGHGVGVTRLVRALRQHEWASGRRIHLLSVLEPDHRGSWMDREADEAVFLPKGATVFDVEPVTRCLEGRTIDVLGASSSRGGPWLAWAELCEARGWKFIGPSAAVLRRLLDPIELRRIAERAGVRTVPWSGGGVESVDQARLHADRIGYPVLCRSSGLVHAAVGIAHAATELPEVYMRASEAARRSSSEVIIERFMPHVRRLEVPVISVPGGERWALDVIDASLRRRDGSVMVEAPAAGLSADVTERLRATTLDLARAFDHQHVGTMIYLLEPETSGITFLGYDFGVGGEHAAAEVLRGMDLAQTRVGMTLGESDIRAPAPPRGSVFVAHVKVRADEVGAPLALESFVAPTGPGVRTDAASSAGDRLVSDSSVAEIMASGADRAEALTRLARALSETSILVQGGVSSIPVLARVLEEPEPWKGPVDCDWLVERVRQGGYRARNLAGVAVVAAAIDAYEIEHAADRQSFAASARRGRPEAQPGRPRSIELEHEGQVYDLVVAARDEDRYVITVEEQTILARVEHRRERDLHLVIGDKRFRVVSAQRGFSHRVEVNGEPHHVVRDESGVVRSSIPAVVASIPVREGDVVEQGDRIAVLEAMKTEMAMVAPYAGRVRRVMARANLQIAPGEPILWIEPSRSRAPKRSTSPRPRIDFAPLATPARPSALDLLTSLARGYDVEADDVRGALREYGATRVIGPTELEREALILRMFVHLLELGPVSTEVEEAADGGLRLSHKEYLRSYLMDLSSEGVGLPASLLGHLRAALAHYGVEDLRSSPRLLEALCRVHMALARRAEIEAVALALLARQAPEGAVTVAPDDVEVRVLLDRVVALTQADLPEISEVARAVRYRVFDGPLLAGIRNERYVEVDEAVEGFLASPSEEAMRRLVDSPHSLSTRVLNPERSTDTARRRVHLEALTRRYYRIRRLRDVAVAVHDGHPTLRADYPHGPGVRTLVSWIGALQDPKGVGAALRTAIGSSSGPTGVDLYTWRAGAATVDAAHLRGFLGELGLPSSVDRVVFVLGPSSFSSTLRATSPCLTFRRVGDGFEEDQLLRDLHPMVAERLEIGRLGQFELERLDAPEDIHLFSARGRGQPNDRRIFVYAEVRDLTTVRDEAGRLVALPQLERVVGEALASLRRIRIAQAPDDRTESNRLELFVWPVLSVAEHELLVIAKKLAPATVGVGLEAVHVNARLPGPDDATGERRLLRLSNPSGLGLELQLDAPSAEPIPLLTPFQQQVQKLRRRGLMHPHELARLITPEPEAASDGLPPGRAKEHDLDGSGERLVPVDRDPGQNVSNIVVFVLESFTPKHPEGMKRVALFGDPSRAMGSLSEPECRRIIAALDLAESMDVPVEWYALSAGAEISKDRGTENMDWISAVLRRIIHFTQDGHELNVVVCGINVGAQPYWNAEATMLMHTKGILVMTPGTAMVLTGKQALDYSGGVSADDNLGIGGYERIMGPNGQAQYFAPDLLSAAKLLLRHYEHAYRAPGERYPRSRPTSDPAERDIGLSPHGAIEGSTFDFVGDVFSETKNPGRKTPFDIRKVMRALVDADSEPLERWRDMRDAETVVTWDGHVGGHPIALIGIESRPIRRLGFVPADGPRLWTAGTLFPQASKKAARAINAASGNRPLVILANLTGFDGSPESLRMCQLEYGAEIGRAIVNFDGPIVFSVVSRYHGGAFVVFSNRLNDRMETLALEGTYASVIGGAPAAAVVFARELKSRVDKDPRITELTQQLGASSGTQRAWLTMRIQQTREAVRSEHLGKLANEYDAIHSIQRAQSVGSVHRIIPSRRLRGEIIEAIERGMAKDAVGPAEP